MKLVKFEIPHTRNVVNADKLHTELHVNTWTTVLMSGGKFSNIISEDQFSTVLITKDEIADTLAKKPHGIHKSVQITVANIQPEDVPASNYPEILNRDGNIVFHGTGEELGWWSKYE